MKLTRSGQSDFLELLKKAQERALGPLWKQEPQEMVPQEERAEIESPLNDRDPGTILDQLLSRVQAAIKGNTTVDLRIIETDLLEIRDKVKGAEAPEAPETLADTDTGVPF